MLNKERGVFLLLLLIAAALIFYRLGHRPLGYPDEIKAAERSRSFTLTHDWLAVRENGAPVFHKPPLQYWINAWLHRLSRNGPELGTRVSTAVFGVLCFALTFLLGRALASEVKWLPALSVFFLLLYSPFLEFCRIGILDAGAAFFFLLALMCATKATQNPAWWYGVGAACLLGSLQKTPLAFFVWATVLVVRWRDPAERAQLFQTRHLPLSLAASVLASLIWPAVQTIRFGESYYKSYVVTELGMMATRQADWGPLTYVIWLLATWFICAGLAFAGLSCVLFSKAWRVVNRRWFEAGVCAAIYLVVASFLRGHSSRYLFPVIPILAICAAGFYLRYVQSWAKPAVTLPVLAAMAFLPLSTRTKRQQRYSEPVTSHLPLILRLKAEIPSPTTPVFVYFEDLARPDLLLLMTRVYADLQVPTLRLENASGIIPTSTDGAVDLPAYGLVSEKFTASFLDRFPSYEAMNRDRGLTLVRVRKTNPHATLYHPARLCQP